MFEIDRSALQDVIESNLINRIRAKYPDLDRIRNLFRSIQTFFGKIPPEVIEHDLVIFADDSAPNWTDAYRSSKDGRLEHMIQFPAVVEFTMDGGFRLWNHKEVTVEELSRPQTLAYRLSQNEHFWVDGASVPIPNITSVGRSVFAPPTYWNLEEALRRYYLERVKRAHECELKHCWHTPELLLWKPRPEASLRDSLYFFLLSVLRGTTEVKREQNMDVDHPVDIKVTWTFSSARALVEIKWLGVSSEGGRITSDFTEARAISGAEQLEKYLNWAETESPDLHHVGYLVVFDGRRGHARNLAEGRVNSIPVEEALKYENADISFTEELLSDTRLKLHNRFFIRPVISGG